jgi:hypothetical protein
MEKIDVKKQIKERIGLFETNNSSIEQLVKDLSSITKINEKKIYKFIYILFQCLEIFLIKNMIYKDTYKKHGVLGMIIRMSDKIDRVYNIEITDLSKGFIYKHDENKQDTFIDIANYSILSLLELEERNE